MPKGIYTTKSETRKAANLRPSTFKTERDWTRGLKEYIRVGEAKVHRGADRFPAHIRRALKLYANRTGREFGEAAAFTASRGASIMLANPRVDIVRDCTEPILQHGSPEDQEWLETFRFVVEAQDHYRRVDIHLSEEEVRPVHALVEILGLQIQTVLALACMHVLKDVPAVRADWRKRMQAECARFHGVLATRATEALDKARRYARRRT